MARPIKFNADYFSHDADMRNDLRIKALRRKFGHEGYSVYNMILELLTDCDDFQFEMSELNLELLSADFDIDFLKLNDIISYLLSIGLMQSETNFLRCKTLENRFEALLSKRKRDRNRVIANENTQSKVKESKLNDSKVNYNREDQPLFFSDMNLLRDELLSSEEWINVTAKATGTNQVEVKKRIPQFCSEMEAKENRGQHIRQYKEYFVNWIRKQINSKTQDIKPKYEAVKYFEQGREELQKEEIEELKRNGHNVKYKDELTDEMEAILVFYWRKKA